MAVQRTIFLRACQVVILAGLLVVQPAPAGEANLSGYMPPFGDVLPDGYTASPDGEFVVYLADQDQDEMLELYSVRVNVPQSLPVKLNLPLVPEGDVSSFKISPDSTRVAYLADVSSDEVFELFSVPLAGPAQSGVRVSPAMSGDADVLLYYEFTPDSQRLVFLADDQVDEQFALFSVPAGGPAQQALRYNPLNSGIPAGTETFKISPDSSRLVFLAYSAPGANTAVLYSAPAAQSGTAVPLNISLQPNGHVSDFSITPLGEKVLYQVYPDLSLSDTDLYVVPIAGPASASTLIDLPEPARWLFYISPDESQAMYWDAEGIYWMPFPGPVSASVKISHDLAPGDYLEDSLQVRPNGENVVYQSHQAADKTDSLYITPITGPDTAAMQLARFVQRGGGSEMDFIICSDSSRIVFEVFVDSPEDIWELYSIPASGPFGAYTHLTPFVGPYTGAYPYLISPDCTQVVYRFVDTLLMMDELFRVPIDGPAGARSSLTGPGVSGREISSFTFLPDDNRVLYRSDREMDDVFELYLVEPEWGVYLPFLLNLPGAIGE